MARVILITLPYRQKRNGNWSKGIPFRSFLMCYSLHIRGHFVWGNRVGGMRMNVVLQNGFHAVIICVLLGCCSLSFAFCLGETDRCNVGEAEVLIFCGIQFSVTTWKKAGALSCQWQYPFLETWHKWGSLSGCSLAISRILFNTFPVVTPSPDFYKVSSDLTNLFHLSVKCADHSQNGKNIETEVLYNWHFKNLVVSPVVIY